MCKHKRIFWQLGDGWHCSDCDYRFSETDYPRLDRDQPETKAHDIMMQAISIGFLPDPGVSQRLAWLNGIQTSYRLRPNYLSGSSGERRILAFFLACSLDEERAKAVASDR